MFKVNSKYLNFNFTRISSRGLGLNVLLVKEDTVGSISLGVVGDHTHGLE